MPTRSRMSTARRSARSAARRSTTVRLSSARAAGRRTIGNAGSMWGLARSTGAAASSPSEPADRPRESGPLDRLPGAAGDPLDDADRRDHDRQGTLTGEDRIAHNPQPRAEDV